MPPDTPLAPDASSTPDAARASNAPRDASADARLRDALLGAWVVERRACEAEVRFLRVTFYRDGRFGTLALDGRTLVYGSWRAAFEPVPHPHPPHPAPPAPARALLTLEFDWQAGPSAEYHLAPEHLPLGPITLHESAGTSGALVLARAWAIEASLVGRWCRAPNASSALKDAPGEPRRPAELDALELRRDGTYLLRATHVGARSASTQVVSQPGRWSFERAPDAPPPVPAAGTLVLDPSDAALPLSRWTVALDDDVPPALHLAAPAPYAPCALHRFAVDPSVRALVARWRLAAPAQAPAPQEFVLHGDGTLELFARPGVPRAPGRWDFARTPAPGAALEGTLALTAHPPGHAVLRDRWRVALPFARNAELEFRLADGRTVLRYRRLFR